MKTPLSNLFLRSLLHRGNQRDRLETSRLRMVSICQCNICFGNLTQGHKIINPFELKMEGIYTYMSENWCRLTAVSHCSISVSAPHRINSTTNLSLTPKLTLTLSHQESVYTTQTYSFVA